MNLYNFIVVNNPICQITIEMNQSNNLFGALFTSMQFSAAAFLRGSGASSAAERHVYSSINSMDDEWIMHQFSGLFTFLDLIYLIGAH